MLEGVVENGTARNIYTPKYRIAGKTGTARLASGSSGYGGGRYRAKLVQIPCRTAFGIPVLS